LLQEVKTDAYISLIRERENYKNYCFTYYDLIQDKRHLNAIAKTHALLRVILHYTDKYKKGLVGYFFKVLKEESDQEHNIPLASANYFYKYIERVRRIGLPAALVNGNTGKPSNNLVLCETVKKLIIFYKSHGNPSSARQIREDLKNAINNNENLRHLRKKIPAETTVRSFLACKEAINLTMLACHDYSEFEAQILGYLPLKKAQNPLTKILIDGYLFQVVCEDDESQQPFQLVGFFIMDDFSGVVMCEIGDVEDYKLIGKAFDKFFQFSRYRLPSEIISDRFSSFQSKYFKSFRKYLKKVGVTWTATSDPKRKGKLERWFGSLQQMSLSRVIGYVGEGIKSTRDNAHPAKEVLVKIKSKEFLKDKDEMKRILINAVDDYNRNAFFTDATSPLDLYRVKNPLNYKQLQPYHVAYFFWEKHEVSINGSMIIIKKELHKKIVNEWFYRNADFQFSLKNGEKVDAYHNPEEDSELYLFKPKTLKFLSTIKKILKAKSALADQTEEDRRIIASFGISKAELHGAYIKKLDEIRSTLKEQLEIDPSVYRKEAQGKKDADEFVLNKIGITSPTKEPDLFVSYKLKKRWGRGAVRRKRSKDNETPIDITDTLG